MIPQNLASVFKETVRRFPDKTALSSKRGGRIESLTWLELSKKVDSVASALLKRGLAPGDRIAILSENRPEWACVDLAAQCVGVITVPVYTSLTPNEIRYILSDCGAALVAVSSKELFEKLVPIHRSLPMLRTVVGFDASLSLSKENLSVNFELLKELESEVSDAADLDQRIRTIPADAVASLIYTSGTTGFPKGVMLTHSNFIHNAFFCKKALQMSESDVHLSFLPLSHVFERLAGHYLMIMIGARISYAENMDSVARDLLEVRPTFILGVPRFYEKIKARVSETLEKLSPFKKRLLFWFIRWKFRMRLGGRVRFCVSGGAALPKETAEFFADLGVVILEGYGLSETAPVISANRQERYKFGSVGLPLDGVEVRITGEGEIVTKSECVMKGYWNKPEETREVLKEGWFYTGDLGLIDKEGFLVITGRKKELIVTSGGKKIAPRAIEEMIENDPCILRCVLFGEGKKFISALIVPRAEKVMAYADADKIAYRDLGDLLRNPRVYGWMDQKIQALCQDLASFERIKYFALLEHDFSQSAGELTPTLKVKRDTVLSRYRDRLLPFYEKEGV